MRWSGIVSGTFINQCGYLATAEIPKAAFKLSHHQKTPAILHCKEIKRSFLDRGATGADYNCLKHACIDGSPPEPLTSTCNYKAFYNYLPFRGVEASLKQRLHTDNGFYDYAGTLSAQATVRYRDTTVDGLAEVVRSQQVDWVYLERSCTDGIPQGGTPKPQLSASSNQEIAGVVRQLSAVEVFAEDGADFAD